MPARPTRPPTSTVPTNPSAVPPASKPPGAAGSPDATYNPFKSRPPQPGDQDFVGPIAPKGAFDAFSESGAAVKFPSGLTRAGHAFEKHAIGQRSTSSKFPKLSGDVKEKNATGQRILNEIVNDPCTTRSLVTGGNFKGGTRFTASDGRQAIFDKNGVFQYFGE
jgi:hypothetical protein